MPTIPSLPAIILCCAAAGQPAAGARVEVRVHAAIDVPADVRTDVRVDAPVPAPADVRVEIREDSPDAVDAFLAALPEDPDPDLAAASDPARPCPDWLVEKCPRGAALHRGRGPREIVLSNGLIRRAFRLLPNAATVAFDNLMTGESILRSVRPEATLRIDGETLAVGGLVGQPEHAYLRPEWLDAMAADPAALPCVAIETGATRERFAWKRVRRSEGRPWPPPGVSLAFRYAAGGERWKGLAVRVAYELFDGIPLLSKWIVVENETGRDVRLEAFTAEILAAVEFESAVEDPGRWNHPGIHVETDYAFLGMEPRGAQKAVFWVPDPLYTTQVNYRLQTPCLLECRPPLGPDAAIPSGGSFESFRVFELPFDGTDRERNGMAVRAMYRTIAPWATENPILMHVRSASPEAVRLAVDQCAAVGFEMVIMTFGSGFAIENEDPAYIAGIRDLVEYAHSRGVELGGYSLLASRRVSDEDDAINPETGKPGGAIFGNSPCLASRWGQEYFRKVKAFIERTGLDILEHDGSYPGDVCASTTHPGHHGLADSQWVQWRMISDFYRWCRGRGVYLNVPDWYFLNGSSKTGMGYRETNWSLPRDRQILLGRQNIHDGTWWKTPSMGWMFVPLVEYHGGGAAATLEPLEKHLDAYGQHLAQNLGAGVQACYRGPRLYDSDATRAVVETWVKFYRKHRAILDSDVVHIRRPDGRDVDIVLHVNPRLSPRALAMVHNPLEERVQRTLALPLELAGAPDTVTISERDGEPRPYALDPGRIARVPIEVPERGLTWLTVE